MSVRITVTASKVSLDVTLGRREAPVAADSTPAEPASHLGAVTQTAPREYAMSRREGAKAFGFET
ncbi:MAG TPA: hypothetical protein VGH54_21365 [Mycobacterium sp.]|jgi:hypothetical protein|uniref:hypothetical protein n=1 Tax=Mycobacterium sp. TaxID=1785 RepID=UPI002F4015EE